MTRQPFVLGQLPDFKSMHDPGKLFKSLTEMYPQLSLQEINTLIAKYGNLEAIMAHFDNLESQNNSDFNGKSGTRPNRPTRHQEAELRRERIAAAERALQPRVINHVPAPDSPVIQNSMWGDFCIPPNMIERSSVPVPKKKKRAPRPDEPTLSGFESVIHDQRKEEIAEPIIIEEPVVDEVVVQEKEIVKSRLFMPIEFQKLQIDFSKYGSFYPPVKCQDEADTKPELKIELLPTIVDIPENVEEETTPIKEEEEDKQEEPVQPAQPPPYSSPAYGYYMPIYSQPMYPYPYPPYPMMQPPPVATQ